MQADNNNDDDWDEEYLEDSCARLVQQDPSLTNVSKSTTMLIIPGAISLPVTISNVGLVKLCKAIKQCKN